MILFFVFLQKKLPQRNYLKISFLLFIIVFINTLLLNLYNHPIEKKYFSHNKQETLERMVNKLSDPNLSISTQNNLIPHLSHREDIYLFPLVNAADYILIDYENDSGWPFESRESFEALFEKILI